MLKKQLFSKKAGNRILLKKYSFYCFFFLNKKHICGIVSAKAIDRSPHYSVQNFFWYFMARFQTCPKYDQNLKLNIN